MRNRTQLVLNRQAHGQNPQLIVSHETMTMDQAEAAGLIEYKLDRDRNAWLIVNLTDGPLSHSNIQPTEQT